MTEQDGQSERARKWQRGGRGVVGRVEWLAVSGFGFHGSKPSLLYYGQPLTTSRTQRFASKTSMRVTDHARSFSACPENSDPYSKYFLPPPPGRILRNFTRDTDTFVAFQLNFPEKLISISRKVGSSTIRPIFGKIIRSDRNRVEIKHLSNIAINRVFRGGEYRHPRASGANTCPDLCIIPKESIPKMPIKVVKGGGKKSKRRIFCLTKQVFSIFERDLFNETGGQSPEVVACFFFFR